MAAGSFVRWSGTDGGGVGLLVDLMTSGFTLPPVNRRLPVILPIPLLNGMWLPIGQGWPLVSSPTFASFRPGGGCLSPCVATATACDGGGVQRSTPSCVLVWASSASPAVSPTR
ncbi:hypothetical protein PVAP13_5NG489230 [Panicum virgatum]|uniref:Uncharacterized protein n=1 Tax=Panicum virgatum TaxID=38727 RepID=A0A8T0S004_PANVG|nr:hypothetical protein PVAP13_5NG489230 [Panicum virgatum]